MAKEYNRRSTVELIDNEVRMIVEGGHGPSYSRENESQIEKITRFEVAKKERGFGFSGVFTGVLVLVKTIIGAALIGVPHAVASSGFVLGGVLFAAVGVLSAFGCHLLYAIAVQLGEAPVSFRTVSKKVLPRWAWLIDVAILFQCLGNMCSYLIIVGGSLPEVARWVGVPSFTRPVAVSVGFMCAAPLACMQYLSALRHFVAIAMVVVIWTAVLTCLFYFRLSPQFEPCKHSNDVLPCDGSHCGPFPVAPLRFGRNIGIFIFAYSCQMNMFTVCNEVHNMTQIRANGIIIVSHLISGCLLYLAGFCGSATYGTAVHPDVLTSYPTGSVMQMSRLLYFVVVVVSYPVQAHPARESAISLLRSVKCSGEGLLYWSTTVGLLIASLTVAIIVGDLGKVYGIIGATSSTMISFIIPGVYYLKISNSLDAQRCLAFALVFIGYAIVLACIGLEFF